MQKEGADKYSRYCILGVVGCSVLNFVLSYVVSCLGLPIYLDMIGTILIAVLAGAYWGIATAVITSLFCCLYYAEALYYAIIAVWIAVCAAKLVKSGKSKKNGNQKGRYLRLIFVLA